MVILFLLFIAHLTAEEPWETAHQQHTSTSPAIYLIHAYQQIISPTCGPRSHYLPTSSEYMVRAIDRHGFFYGYLLGCDRLLRENNEEWLYRKIRTPTGYAKWDPVPLRLQTVHRQE